MQIAPNPTSVNHTVKEHNIRELQEKLRGLSYSDDTLPRPPVTGVRDEITDRALLAFQRQTGLEESGIADLATWNALDDAHSKAAMQYTPLTPLYPVPGNAFFALPLPDSFVYLLQVLLSSLSAQSEAIPPTAVNGKYDEPTARAVSAVQSLSGLPPTGRMDAPTWTALAALYNLETIKFISSPPIQ